MLNRILYFKYLKQRKLIEPVYQFDANVQKKAAYTYIDLVGGFKIYPSVAF